MYGSIRSRACPSLHAVVAQKMLAGVIDTRREKLIERSLIEPFEKRRRVVVPGFGTWKRAGAIVARLVQGKLLSPGGVRALLRE